MQRRAFHAAALLCGLALVTTGCGGSQETIAPKKAPAVKVGLLLDTTHERWERDRDLINEVVTDMGGELMVAWAEGDQARQNEQAAKMVADGAAVLIVVAHDTNNAASVVETAKAKNVPVISYDRLIRNADVDVYIGFDTAKIGRLQAQHMLARAPKGNYLLIGGAENDGNSHELRKAQMEVLEPEVKSGAIRIVHQGWAANWSAAAAAALTETALTKSRNNLAAIVASNDVTAGGAIEVLTKRGLAGKVAVSGQDAELAAAQRIVAGTQTMTVYKSLRTLTRLAARSAMLLAKGEKVDTSSVTANGMKDVPTMLFDPIAVDKNNIDGVLIADGFLKRADVYGAGASAP
jgi:D-xylose transport system substrate-binding protein